MHTVLNFDIRSLNLEDLHQALVNSGDEFHDREHLAVAKEYNLARYVGFCRDRAQVGSKSRHAYLVGMRSRAMPGSNYYLSLLLLSLNEEGKIEGEWGAGAPVETKTQYIPLHQMIEQFQSFRPFTFKKSDDVVLVRKHFVG